MREKQIGVTLSAHTKAKLAKVAQMQGRSKSSLCALAIEAYLDDWLMSQPKAPQPTGSTATIFGTAKKTAFKSVFRSKEIARMPDPAIYDEGDYQAAEIDMADVVDQQKRDCNHE